MHRSGQGRGTRGRGQVWCLNLMGGWAAFIKSYTPCPVSELHQVSTHQLACVFATQDFPLTSSRRGVNADAGGTDAAGDGTGGSGMVADPLSGPVGSKPQDPPVPHNPELDAVPASPDEVRVL